MQIYINATKENKQTHEIAISHLHLNVRTVAPETSIIRFENQPDATQLTNDLTKYNDDTSLFVT